MMTALCRPGCAAPARVTLAQLTLARGMMARGIIASSALALLGGIAAADTPPAARAQEAPDGCTGTPGAAWIAVSVEGVRNSNGLIAITLYPDVPRRFLVRHGSLYVGRVPAHEGTTHGCIYVPKPGVYAIAIYHDENASQTFDRTGIGLPAEGYGFSNNPSTLLGLPAFRTVRLAIPHSGLLTRIRLTYP